MSFFIHLLVLLFFSIIGNGISFIFIFLGFQMLGGALLVLNPFLIFFIVFGRLMLKGEQVVRVNEYMVENGLEMSKELRREGILLFYSFTNREVDPSERGLFGSNVILSGQLEFIPIGGSSITTDSVYIENVSYIYE